MSVENTFSKEVFLKKLLSSLVANSGEFRRSKTGWSDELFHQNYLQPLIDESLTEPDLDTRKQWAVALLDFYATGKTSNQLHATEIMKYFLLTWTIEGKSRIRFSTFLNEYLCFCV